MPRAISNIGVGSLAAYKLGASEEFAVLAITFAVSATIGGAGNIVFCDFRDAANASIHRQPLGTIANNPIYFSLTTEAEPWQIDAAANYEIPQNFAAFGNSTTSQRIPQITLTSACSLLVYTIPAGDLDPLTDPLQYVDTTFVVNDLHLWVEDTAFARGPSVQVGPYMLVGGPNA